MESLPVSEVLPGLYRAVLDGVAHLESIGRRRDAAGIRAEATAAYSGAWNAAADRRLRSLRERAERLAESQHRKGPRALESRPRSADLGHTPI
ncbi:MAG TPA: hypothetical protein VFP56_03360 [Candidatus Limnocylindrales bacterium]|nr:hypothetical protein [Candidatus Limnocylindrales bacterium]